MKRKATYQLTDFQETLIKDTLEQSKFKNLATQGSYPLDGSIFSRLQNLIGSYASYSFQYRLVEAIQDVMDKEFGKDAPQLSVIKNDLSHQQEGHLVAEISVQYQFRSFEMPLMPRLLVKSYPCSIKISGHDREHLVDSFEFRPFVRLSQTSTFQCGRHWRIQPPKTRASVQRVEQNSVAEKAKCPDFIWKHRQKCTTSRQHEEIDCQYHKEVV